MYRKSVITLAITEQALITYKPDIDYPKFELRSIEDSIDDHANTRMEYNMVDMVVIEAQFCNLG